MIILAFLLGLLVGWWLAAFLLLRPSPEVAPEVFPPYVAQALPLLGEHQSVPVLFMDGDIQVHHRGYASTELTPILTRPKGGEPEEWFRFSHVDERGCFVYLKTAPKD